VDSLVPHANESVKVSGLRSSKIESEQ